MTLRASTADLRERLVRWEELLPRAEGTYCQGIANKAFGVLEQLLKQLLERRLHATSAELSGLLTSVRYNGNVKTVEKLPPGTLVAVLAKLAESDSPLGLAFSGGLRRQLDSAVAARNLATHEVLGELLRERTASLLTLIGNVVSNEDLVGLLDP